MVDFVKSCFYSFTWFVLSFFVSNTKVRFQFNYSDEYVRVIILFFFYVYQAFGKSWGFYLIPEIDEYWKFLSKDWLSWWVVDVFDDGFKFYAKTLRVCIVLLIISKYRLSVDWNSCVDCWLEKMSPVFLHSSHFLISWLFPECFIFDPL